MRLFIAVCVVISILPGLALAQQNTKPTHSGRGGASIIMRDTGGGRTPGQEGGSARNNGQQSDKQGGQQKQGNTK